MKKIEEINLRIDDKFKDAFKDGHIPSNSYIDKSKTGLGMTFSEINAQRNSIIVIPYTSIIELKAERHKSKNLLKVLDKGSERQNKQIKAFLSSNSVHKKILTTPESFKKLIDAATEIGKLYWMYNNFFCFLDEAHCYAVEKFREHILKPFDYFWKFKDKSLGTATYYDYSDPKFESLQLYKIKYDKPLGKIKLLNHETPNTVLIDILSNLNEFPGNIHVFYNSITQIEKVIRYVKLKNVNIYCRDDEKNFRTLRDSAIYFRNKPDATSFKKVNFYTAKYFEGWDLFDTDSCTIILVTDKKIAHSIVGIQYGGFQAVGRLRNVMPREVYHITNDFGKCDADVKPFKDILVNCYYHAQNHVRYHNEFKLQAAADKMENNQVTWQMAKLYCRFDTSPTLINSMKVDQLICEGLIKEGYANLNSIIATWKEMNYEVETQKSDLMPITVIGQSRAEVNRQVIESIENYRQHPELYFHVRAEITLGKLRKKYTKLISAYHTLGPEKLKALGYDDNKIARAMIDLSNDNLLPTLQKKVIESVQQGHEYTLNQISSLLQPIYEEIGYLGYDGKCKVAKASQLESLGLFKIKKTARTIHTESCNRVDRCDCRRMAVWILERSDSTM